MASAIAVSRVSTVSTRATGDFGTAVGHDDCSWSPAFCAAFIRSSKALCCCEVLNHLFDALRRQVDEAARPLTARGRHITSRRSALGRAVHRVEPLPLFIAQRLVELLKRRADNLYGFDSRIKSLLGGIEAANRCERNRAWARRRQRPRSLT
jgi:hypothetical protein